MGWKDEAQKRYKENPSKKLDEVIVILGKAQNLGRWEPE